MTSQKFPLIPELSKDIFTRKEILSEEKKETKKICVLSNCPHSHSSSHEQWQELAWFMNHHTTPENTSFLILFSTTVFSDSLQLHVLWHTRLPCPSNCPEFLQIYVHWVNDVMQPSHPVLFHSPPALNFPSIRVFTSDLALGLRWQKYWLFGSHQSIREQSVVISLRIAWFNLPAVHGTFKNLLQPLICKAPVLWHSVLMVPHSPPYTTSGKTALTIETFFNNVYAF